MDNIEYQQLIDFIKRHISIDGNLYKERPFKRRIAVRMRSTDKKTYGDYLEYLRIHSDEINKLKNTLTINVTRFFRNRETFEYLLNVTFKDVVRKNETLRILSAGCSTGEEPYTLAIMLNGIKRRSEFNYEIVGIDVDSEAVEKAKSGVYTEHSFTEVNSEEIEKYFIKSGSSFVLRDDYKRNVEFKIMDIKESEKLLLLGKFDMIVCRNILIYFSKDFQESILSDFHRILKTNGYLVLGKVEIITGPVKEMYETINRKERIFKKIDN